MLEVKETGATSLHVTELATIRSTYDTIIAAGHVANPAPPPLGRRGRTKKTKAANLLGRLDTYADDVLRFATVMKNGQNPLGALQRLMVADPWMPPVADSG